MTLQNKKIETVNKNNLSMQIYRSILNKEGLKDTFIKA